MIKKNKAGIPEAQDTKEMTFEDFMQAFEEMEPEEAKNVLKTIIEVMEEEGDSVPFPLRLVTTGISFGLSQTPVGLAYGFGGLGQLMITGFVGEDDREIEEIGGTDAFLEMMIEDFQENFPMIATTRDDEVIGALLQSALDGTYQVTEEFFETMEATELQRAVWKELTKIPYGKTISYEELAKRVGKPKAVRAVASAVGNNPIPIAIPCHRVILKNGKSGQYRWDPVAKEKLLAYEQAKAKA